MVLCCEDVVLWWWLSKCDAVVVLCRCAGVMLVVWRRCDGVMMSKCDAVVVLWLCYVGLLLWGCVSGVIRLLLYSMSSTVRRLYPRSWVRSTLVCSDQNEAKMMTNFQILSCTISIAKKVGRFATDDVTSFEVLKLVFLAFYIFTHPSMQPTPEFWPKLSVSVLLKDQWT